MDHVSDITCWKYDIEELEVKEWIYHLGEHLYLRMPRTRRLTGGTQWSKFQSRTHSQRGHLLSHRSTRTLPPLSTEVFDLRISIYNWSTYQHCIVYLINFPKRIRFLILDEVFGSELALLIKGNVCDDNGRFFRVFRTFRFIGFVMPWRGRPPFWYVDRTVFNSTEHTGNVIRTTI